MTLLKLKAGGLALVVLGGLALAHGASTGRTWEAAIGVLVLGIGLALLAAKVIWRTTPTPRDAEH